MEGTGSISSVEDLNVLLLSISGHAEKNLKCSIPPAAHLTYVCMHAPLTGISMDCIKPFE